MGPSARELVHLEGEYFERLGLTPFLYQPEGEFFHLNLPPFWCQSEGDFSLFTMPPPAPSAEA